MPLNQNLNVQFSVADETAINGALNTVNTTITTLIGQPFNLSDQERRSTRTISNERYPFASRAILDFGPNYPALASIEVPLAKAENNFAFYTQLSELENRLHGLLDLVGDLKINAGYLAMKFTDDQYGNAKNYRNGNVPGADTVYDEQFPLYDREQSNELVGGGGTP